jgi:hypothetical protein
MVWSAAGVELTAKRVEHWFNRRYGVARRDVYLLRTATGWHLFGRADPARQHVATKDRVPAHRA